MHFRVALCDDSPEDIMTLSNQITKYGKKYDIHFDMEHFDSGSALVQAHHKSPFNIIFLDIEMPAQSGITTARHLRNDGNDDVFIIFVTSYPEYMRDSFEVQPFQFITKPVNTSVISKLFASIMHKYTKSHTSRVILDDQGTGRVTIINDILYIKTSNSDNSILEYVLTSYSFTGKGVLQTWEDEPYVMWFFLSPQRLSCEHQTRCVFHKISAEYEQWLQDPCEQKKILPVPAPFCKQNYKKSQLKGINKCFSI